MVAVFATMLFLAVPSAAGAKGGGASAVPKLSFFNCVTDGALYGPCNPVQPGSADWVKTTFADGTHGFAVALTTAANPDGSGYVSYAGDSVVNAGIVGQTLAQVTALSFDTTGIQGGGSPRISLILNNSGPTTYYAYLDPEYCETQIGSSAWRHADFRMAPFDAYGSRGLTPPPPCTIYTTFGVFSNDGGYTAWNWMNAASLNLDGGGPLTVTAAFLVQDVGPGTSMNTNLTFDGAVVYAPPGHEK